MMQATYLTELRNLKQNMKRCHVCFIEYMLKGQPAQRRRAATSTDTDASAAQLKEPKFQILNKPKWELLLA